MLDFATSFLGWLVATTVPALLGLALIMGVGARIRARYLCAFGIGILFWFFVDTIQGSADLDVGAGFSGGAQQVAIMGLFALGVLTIFALGPGLFSAELQNLVQNIRLPIIVAVALGIHGLGEGAAFGGTAASTSSTSLIGAFGGVDAGGAYALHKALEPMMIGVVYSAYVGVKGRPFAKDLLQLTGLFVLPSVIGAATGYFVSYDSTYFFALGTGTAVYAALSMTRPLFQGSGTVTAGESMKVGLSLIVGLVVIYLAALLHS